MYWITGLLGAVSVVAPFVFNYSMDTFATITSIIFGIALITLSILEGYSHGVQRWEYTAMAVVGVVALAIPIVYGFTSSSAFWTSLIIGFIVVGISMPELGIKGLSKS